ncbi:MAG: PIN domain-containing protein [Chloroflexi bacterium]|nr:MAG: PIN domain-containing protein [Chloroflexota bacterium]
MLIVDAGPLVAAAWTGDRDHRRCVDLLSGAPWPLLVPALVAAEAASLIGDRLGPAAELAFGQSFANGELVLEPLEPTDLDRVVELMARYVDLPLGMADASVVAAAERLGATRVATLDRRHFSAVRPRHVESLALVPA